MSKIKEYLSEISIEIGKCGVIDAEVMMVALNREAAQDSVTEFWAHRCEQFDVVYPFDMRVDELIAIGFEDSCYSDDQKPSLRLEHPSCVAQVWYGFHMERLCIHSSELQQQIRSNESYSLTIMNKPAYPNYREVINYIEFMDFNNLMEYIEAYLQKHGGSGAN
jgi:hypothetical protein